MTPQNTEFEPTHVLLVEGDRRPSDLTSRERVDRTNAAFFASLDRADEVALRCNVEWCADEFPDIARQLVSSAVRAETDDESADEFTTLIGDGADFRAGIRFLLDRTSHHRSYMLDSIDLYQRGDMVVTFDPEHDRFELDGAAADPEFVSIVRTAVAETGARLIPGGVRAEWTSGDGRQIRLDPPYLDEENWIRIHLHHLKAVTVDDRRRHITFEWDEDHVGTRRPADDSPTDGLLGRLRQSIFPPPRSPPRESFVDSPDAYEDVASGLERVSKHLDFEIKDGSS